MAPTISFGDANRGFQAGINYGTINVEFRLPPERLETPPRPSIVIPFSRDIDFVERREILSQIETKCAAPGSRTALVGMGGVGKSQLAIEYAYRMHERSPETWVFWVHASNAVRLEQGFRNIACYVKVHGWQNPKANIFQLVHDWLQDQRKGRWVLILDNVDDASFLLEARSASHNGQMDDLEGIGSRPLISYIPQCQNGSVLITSRSRQVESQLVEPHGIVAVGPMDERDALTLLRKKICQKNINEELIGDKEEIADLADVLEFMPLAMVQAAAYISERKPRCSVQQYLRDFRKSDHKRTNRLKCQGGQLRRDWEAKSSIIMTWQISFDYIRQIQPSAADLLSLISLYDFQGIPDVLLRIRVEEGIAQQDQEERDSDHQDWAADDDNSSQSSARDRFEDDVQILRNYSFISANIDRTTLDVHSLVQLATRDWLKAQGHLEKWQKKALQNMATAFPNGEPETWADCQVLLSHARKVLTYVLEGDEATQNRATIAKNTAWYLLHMGDYKASETIGRSAITAWKGIRGPEHENTLICVSRLGSALVRQGNNEEAAVLHDRVLEAREKVLGPEHPDTITSLSYLGSVLERQGKLDRAEALHLRALEVRRKLLGPEHQHTLTSASLLGQVLSQQNKYEEAEAMHRKVLEGREKILGLLHPRTLDSTNFLAQVLL